MKIEILCKSIHFIEEKKNSTFYQNVLTINLKYTFNVCYNGLLTFLRNQKTEIKFHKNYV